MDEIRQRSKATVDEVKQRSKATADEMKQRSKAAADEVKQRSKAAADEVKQRTKETADEVKQRSKAAADEVKQRTKETADEVKQRTKETADEVKQLTKTTAKKIIRTAMMNRYLLKFIVRLGIFGAVLAVYLIRKDILVSFMTHQFTFGISDHGISLLHVLWALFMVMMLRHLIPPKYLSMALRKQESVNYREVPGYSELELLRFVQDMNAKSWTVLLVWLCLNAVFGFLYLFRVIDNADLLMLTVFYFLCDYICILFFCPFQTFIMKNKCCVNCRIYDWGHFMMFTPMLLIRNFFSWTLFFTSVIVLIRWELVYAKHPERFWFGSNQTLQCASCQDKTCVYKKKLKQHHLFRKN